MNLVQYYSRFTCLILLIISISNAYAKKQVALEAEGAVVSEVCNASIGCDIADSGTGTTNGTMNSCEGTENCIVVAENCDDNPNALVCNSVSNDDVEQEYTADNCKVTIYKNGSVRMVDVNTDKPCDGPIPADHKFSKEPVKVYEKDGCILTTYGPDGVMDCSKKSKRRK